MIEIKNWPLQKNKIREEIASTKSHFKIILKTKNEPELLEEWIKHHSKIVAPKCLIVIDNNSSNRLVFEIYERYKEKITIISFKENHNLVHDPIYFEEFYTAIRGSCKYFSFIDTDEFIYAYRNASLISEYDYFAQTLSKTHDKIFPTYWAINIPGNKDILYINDIPSRFPSGIKGGKPIIASSIDLKKITHTDNTLINHNIQLKIEDEAILEGGMLVAHLNMISPDVRKRANIQKILAHKFASSLEEINSTLELIKQSPTNLNKQYIDYLNEINNCNTQNWGRLQDAPEGCIKINSNGTLQATPSTLQFLHNFSKPTESSWKSYLIKSL